MVCATRAGIKKIFSRAGDQGSGGTVIKSAGLPNPLHFKSVYSYMVVLRGGWGGGDFFAKRKESTAILRIQEAIFQNSSTLPSLHIFSF